MWWSFLAFLAFPQPVTALIPLLVSFLAFLSQSGRPGLLSARNVSYSASSPFSQPVMALIPLLLSFLASAQPVWPSRPSLNP